MLPTKAFKYIPSGDQPLNQGPGLYYPDSIVDSVLNESFKTTPSMFRNHLGKPEEFSLLDAPTGQIIQKRFTLNQSKDLVIKAFSDFDPELGRRAKVIFDDPARWNLQEVAPGTARMMRSRPAESPGDEYNPPNPLSHSVIDYDFDGTIDAVVYLAHEVGHSIADDYAREAGGSFRNTPGHLNEFQAYLPQQILYGSLMQNPDPEIAEAGRRQYLATIATSLYNLPLGLEAKKTEIALREGKTPSHNTVKDWFGDDWNRHTRADEIIKTLQATGADTGPKGILGEQIRSMHERPLGVLVSAALYEHLKTEDLTTRRRTLETLFQPFDQNGSKGISEVLSTSGIEHASQMGQIMDRTLKSASSLLTRQTERNIGHIFTEIKAGPVQ